MKRKLSPRKSKAASRSAVNRGVGSRPKVLTPELLEAELLDEEGGSEDETVEGEAIESSIEAGEEQVGGVPASVSSVALEDLPVSHPQRDILRQYLHEVSRYTLLTPEEELALALKLKETGDIEAARRLVRANLRLVVKIAMEYRSAYQNVMDLIQEGNIGLMKAVSKFDPLKGAKLSYYASWWIRSYILKYILDNFRLVRLGTTQAQKKLFFHLVREKERLEAQGIEAGPKLLAEKLHVREKDVIEMEQRLGEGSSDVSLDRPLGGGGGESGETRTTYLELLEDQEGLTDETLANEELRRILGQRIEGFSKTLEGKELVVFRERLGAEEPKTLQEIADQYGLTRERVRQIEVQVVAKLRDYFKKWIR